MAWQFPTEFSNPGRSRGSHTLANRIKVAALVQKLHDVRQGHESVGEACRNVDLILLHCRKADERPWPINSAK
jgi:hypothetical protein